MVKTNLTGSDQTIDLSDRTRRIYYGFSVKETSGTARASLTIYAGTDNTGDILDVITLSAGESAREFYGPDGIPADSDGQAVFIDIESGAVSGSVRTS